MEINATIIGQFITFAILIFVTMKYIWPPITKAMHDREAKIVAGLEAAKQGKLELDMAEHKAQTIIREAKQQASQIIENTNIHSAKLLEESKGQAKIEGARLIEMAQGDIEREVAQAKEALKKQVVNIALAGAEKIIQRQLDQSAHEQLLNDIAAEL
jgi:F-type H+-transporting ATPase subunit b